MALTAALASASISLSYRSRSITLGVIRHDLLWPFAACFQLPRLPQAYTGSPHR